jgi:hypothetical protein
MGCKGNAFFLINKIIFTTNRKFALTHWTVRRIFNKQTADHTLVEMRAAI